MNKNINNKNLVARAMSLAAILFFVFGASSCADSNFISEPEFGGENPGFVGDTLIRMDEFDLHHGAWEVSNGLLKADHYFDGYIEYKVNDEVVKSTIIDHENAPMSIKWEPIVETIDTVAVKKYLGCEAGDAILVESHKNQEVSFSQYKRECKLSFEGMEVTLTGSWYEASLGTAKKYCRYDSTTIASQHADFEMKEGEKVTVEKDGQKYNRIIVTVQVVHYFTDMPAKEPHVKLMDIVYTVLVPVGTEPTPEPEDEFLGFDKEIIPGNNDQPAQIIITEHWSVSGDKTLTFAQNANYFFAVSGQQRVFGEKLTFVSGPSKSTDDPRYNEVKENQFVRTVTTTTSVSFNPSCEVKAIAGYNEAYIEYRDQRIDFEFAAATVSYEGINNPTATEVTVDGTLFSRKAYEVSFSHNLLGEKKASVLVDQEIDLEPTIDPEWKIDIEKTKAFGKVSISWEERDGKFYPFYSGTIICNVGVISYKTDLKNFTKMNTNNITRNVGNAWDGSKLYPSYIDVNTSGNISWQYYDVVSGALNTDVYSSKMVVEGGFDKTQPFVGNGNDANIYQITENGNTVRVVVVYQGQVIFNEVFAK